jgi:hypothetical protein
MYNRTIITTICIKTCICFNVSNSLTVGRSQSSFFQISDLEVAMKAHSGGRGIQRSSILSLTSSLDVCGWLRPRLGHFTPGKETRYPLYRRLGVPQGWSGRVWKISSQPGFDPRTFQPEASGYTARANSTHF